MRSVARALGLCVVSSIPTLVGCAAGSATAGYSVTAGSADDLKSTARQSIVADSVKQSNAYTDQQIAQLKAELAKAK